MKWRAKWLRPERRYTTPALHAAKPPKRLALLEAYPAEDGATQAGGQTLMLPQVSMGAGAATNWGDGRLIAAAASAG